MKTKHYFILIIILILFFGLFFIFQCKKENSENIIEQKPILKIGYRSHVFYAPLFVSLERGYFDEYNIDVEAVEFESTNQMVEAMLANRIDASLGGVNTFILFNIEEKTPGNLKIFSLTEETSDNPLTYLLVKNDSDITNIADLENKTIGTYMGSAIQILYRKYISANNLSNTSLSQMAPSLQLQALEAEQVDAIVVIEPTAAIGSQKNISTSLESALFDKYFLQNIPITSSVIRNSLAQEQPELANKLIAITEKASEFINKNPEEAKLIISKYTSLTENIANKINLPEFSIITSDDIQKLNDLKQVLAEEGEIEGTANASNMILEIK